MKTIEGQAPAVESEPAERLNFRYSVESEIKRLDWHLNGENGYSWYKENGYNLSLPQAAIDIINSGRIPTLEEVTEIVKEDFDENLFASEAVKISKEWNKIASYFFGRLVELGGEVQEEYKIGLSKYGTSGSYGLPNFIQLNILKGSHEVDYIIAHEIVHLVVEPWILEFGIDHWTKERIIDHIMYNFFPARKRFQRDPKNKVEIVHILRDSFPDMKQAIKRISEVQKGESSEPS